MIAPRRPLPSRLIRTRWRALPAARGLRRRAAGGAAWLPVGLRWRRLARPVSGAAAPLPMRALGHTGRERHGIWRVRTLILPAAAPRRPDAARGLPGARGAAGPMRRGATGRNGAMVYRTGPATQLPSRSPLHPMLSPPTMRSLPPLQSPPTICRRPPSAVTAAMPAARVTTARMHWTGRSTPATPTMAARQRVPAALPIRWSASPAAAKAAGRLAAGAASGAPVPAPAGQSRHVNAGAMPAAARIDWRVRTPTAADTPRAAAATIRALAQRAELVWRSSADAARSEPAAAARGAPRHVAARVHPDAPIAAASSPASAFAARAPAAAAMLDAAATERLVEDVLRRAEQRLRIERERRGL